MTIEEMKKQKQKLIYDIAALIAKFETESGMAVYEIEVNRHRSVQIGHPEVSGFSGIELAVRMP